MSDLPKPGRARWQPLRAGLVDIFYYDQEEFRFRDGRLLLRGNNGTGKSKVLALTLPFLLDGELAAHRVEPDGDRSKRMEWNLLLGGEHPSEDRLGYSWLEFGRLGDDGVPMFCTVGCGMKAMKGRGISAHWFFLTTRRVGEDLALMDSTRVALGRDRLEAAIGTSGTVYRTAREYRRAIDEKLFGLGEQRYGALLDLLLKVRAPQLSKRPDERGLSQALTDALPPLDQALIADVAEAFRALEENREDLAAMVEARDASARYLGIYTSYARIACRRRAAPLRQAQSTLDRVSRELAEAQAAWQQAQAELALAEQALRTLRAEEDRLRARGQALRESPEARSARELALAAEDARLAGLRAGQAQVALGRASERLALMTERLTAADAKRADADAELDRARAEAREHAVRARIGSQFLHTVDELIEAHDRDDLRRRAAGLAEAQQRSIDRVRGLLGEAAQRLRELGAARERHEQLASEQAQVAERREQAVGSLDAVGRAYVHAAREHLEAAVELLLPELSEPLAALELWIETLTGPNPLDAAVAEAGRAAGAELARAGALLDAQLEEARRFGAELADSIARLEAGEHDAPPVPYTRDPAGRDGRAGAPLWQVVDFRPEVPAADRAGIEAGLEAAGILDAWVTPDGALLAPGTDDVLLATDGAATDGAATDGAGATDCASLEQVLAPAIDPASPIALALSERAVRGVLAAIGIGDAHARAWVAPDGQFRNGVLRGAWRKQVAKFIGHGTREAARRERLAELRQQLADAGEVVQERECERAALAQRRTRLEAELDQVPGDVALRAAHGALTQIEAELARVLERVATAQQREREAAVASDAAELALRRDAEDLGLPMDAAGLEQVQSAIHEFREGLARLWPALSARDRAREAHSESRADADRARAEVDESTVALAGAEREHAERSERRDTLQETAGAAIAELQRQLSAVADALRENERQRSAADQRRARAQRDEGREEGRRGELERELEQATESRRGAIDGLRRFAGSGLIEVALGEVELPEGEDWGVTAALRLARQIEQELSTVLDDDAAWQRAQQRANDDLGALADALRRHGHNAAASLREEGISVEVTFRGHGMTVPSLAAALQEEVQESQRLLDEREREILENHLVNEVASTLQELIGDAERQLARTNAELADRPTSTGMQLRLRWVADTDGPQGLAQARERLLRQTSDAWSEEDRAAVGKFLHARIQEVRVRDVAGTWIEHLTEALDYRRWHRFVVERRQAGTWRSAMGPSSGGERVLAASVPMFAAASSYYASAANVHAPRLVMLDEAFAGVDDNARGKCLGLLAAFDLDVVMTSEREWGCYPEVPGLAIAQLSRFDDVAAVLVTHWEWNGFSRQRVERPVVPLAAAAAPDEQRQDGLALWPTSITGD